MPTVIRLTDIPGIIRIDRGYRCETLNISLCHPPLATEDVTIRRTEEVAPAVRGFGERIRAAHPDASFKISISIPKAQRKPAGFDAAQAAGTFGERAFMHTVATDAPPAKPTPTPAAVP